VGRVRSCHRSAWSQGDFTHRSHLIATLYAQLAGSVRLRDIEAGLSSHAKRLYHIHATAPKRATLAEANRNRPAEIFSDLPAGMIQQLHRKLRRSMDGVPDLIDSTGLALNALSSRWAQFSAKVCAGSAVALSCRSSRAILDAWPDLA
jgi:hypothetical protein